MSNNDPFGPGGKTVIRPVPGGGAPAGPPPAAPGGGGGNRPQPQQWPPPGGAPQPQWQPGGAPPQQPQWQPAPAGQPPQPQWQPGAPPQQWPPAGPPAQGYNPRVTNTYSQPQWQGGGGVQAPPPDAWLAGPAPGQQMFPDYSQQQPQQAPVAKIPLEVALAARDGGQISAANPITAAATSLLILLGRLRLLIIDMQAAPLMQHVATEIQQFEQRCLQSGVDPTDTQVAKFALCATADDIVQNLPGTDRHLWLQYSMVAQFFQRRDSGVVFYEELGKILHNPAPRYNLLELMHACLSLGFEGQYRGSPNGQNELQRARRDVYQTLRNLKARNDDDVSPRWRGLDLKMGLLNNRIPLWAIGSAAAALMLAAFFLFRILLGGDSDALFNTLVTLHPNGPLTLERASFVPAPVVDNHDPTQLERIRGKLDAEIKAGGLSVDGAGDFIVVEVNNTLLFDSGRADVRKDFLALAASIGNSLESEPGPIKVIGYTDNVKPSGVGRFKSNEDLSLARAKAVQAVLGPYISNAGRFETEGRGELDPIGDNNTDDGRAQNRRVEIMIPREETLKPAQT